MRDRACTMVVAAFCVICVAPVTYWASDREPPFVRGTGYIIPQAVSPEGEFEVHWEGKRVKDCGGVVHRFIRDSKGDLWALPSSTVRYSKITENGVPLNSAKIPRGIACGPAEYVADALHVCNITHRIWPIRVNTPTIKFTIACGE